MIRRLGRRGGGFGTPGGGDSSFAEHAWDKSRGAARRWAAAGAVVGAVAGIVVFAPAAWLASALAGATGERVILADARGTLWSGSAMAVLTGGPGSRDAVSLPGRLSWDIGLAGPALEVRLEQACCLNGRVKLRLQPGFGRHTLTLLPPPGWVAQWPSALLAGLGTPFNTLQLGGMLRLVSPGVAFESVQGRWRMSGSADLELQGASSRLSTLETLGSYRLTLSGDPGNAGVTRLNLGTLDGALQLSGSGTWAAGGVNFRGEARSAEADAGALNNLLNIIGRRDGARSVISIG